MCGTVVVRVLRNLQSLRACIQNLASREKYSGLGTFLVSSLNLKPLMLSSGRLLILHFFMKILPSHFLVPGLQDSKITALLVEGCLEREGFVPWKYSDSD